MTRFNNSFFNGYCYYCNYFGHKAINCRVFARNNFRLMNRNSFVPLRNYNIICYNCNNFGETARVCRSGVAIFFKKVDTKGKAKESNKV